MPILWLEEKIRLHKLPSKPFLDYVQAMHDLTIYVVPFDLDKDGALYDDWSLGTWIPTPSACAWGGGQLI